MQTAAMEREQPWVLSGCVYICLTDCILNMNIKINFNFDSFVDYYYPELLMLTEILKR